MKKISILLPLALVFLVSGCANKVHTYSTSTENTLILQELAKYNKKIKLGKFDDSGKNETTVMCRLATPVGTAKGETFASYIEDSLIKELVIANLYDQNNKNILTANLDDIYGSTTVGNAYWQFNVTINSSDGDSYAVESTYDYESSYLATSACSEMQRSFVPAVQKLNKDIIQHPSFVELLKNQTNRT
jgi:hypothetical protein